MPELISMEECFEAGFIPSNASCRREPTVESLARPLPEDDDEGELIDEELHPSIFDEDDLDGDDPCEVHCEENCRLCLLTT